VVLFGDTQAAQTGRKIQGLSPEAVKIYCNAGDGVCKGTLAITQAHFQHTPFVAPAAEHLISRIDAKLGKSDAAPSASEPAAADEGGEE
jgi:cutinase